MAWVGGRHDRGIYWLSGMAGTGKSTIARTISQRCATQKQLGASFFFVRGGGDLASARKFVTTIAVQLAAASAPLKRHICRALRSAPNIGCLALQEQWQKLVLEPLAHARRFRFFASDKPLVLVIDALDECNSEDDVALLLQLLSSTVLSPSSSPMPDLARNRLRIFVTSRPETLFRHCFDAISEANLQRLVLHRIDPPIVGHDIELYFNAKPGELGRTYLHDYGWPGATNTQRLVERAGGRFIWAATACRFIEGGRRFADDRLHEVLQADSSGLVPERNLSQIYLMVLRKAVKGNYSEREAKDMVDSLNTIVGSIAVLSLPLANISLSRLLGISSSGISRVLHSLHSIFDIQDELTSLIRLHHASFRDFLLDTERCDDARFWVDGPQRHTILAQNCLSSMRGSLRHDICHLKAPGTLLSEVNPARVADKFSPEIQYACCYWADHFCNADNSGQTEPLLCSFFQEHSLHWIEALSLLGLLSISVPVLTAPASLKASMHT